MQHAAPGIRLTAKAESRPMNGPDLRSPWTPGRDELAALLHDQPNYRVDQLWSGLYEHKSPPAEITNLPKDIRERLGQHYAPQLRARDIQQSRDGRTSKWLWELADGAQVETVLMHYNQRSTVCISTQAGCAMACGFCATGQGGFRRNLTVGEILEQVVEAARASQGRRVSNVVFMGMGEPFSNYDRVMIALRRLISDFGIGARKITVSTVGLVPQIRRFTATETQAGLAVSLHAANDDLRDQLVPINRRHPLYELLDACLDHRESTGRRVSLEWAMIDGVNDRDSDAVELADFAREADAHVNLIPLNPTPGWPTVGSPAARVKEFAAELSKRKVNATIRANRGTDIDAACGQLTARHTANTE